VNRTVTPYPTRIGSATVPPVSICSFLPTSIRCHCLSCYFLSTVHRRRRRQDEVIYMCNGTNIELFLGPYRNADPVSPFNWKPIVPHVLLISITVVLFTFLGSLNLRDTALLPYSSTSAGIRALYPRSNHHRRHPSCICSGSTQGPHWYTCQLRPSRGNRMPASWRHAHPILKFISV
jgi:hypothetical protein